MPLCQPSNQKKHTNVAVVVYKAKVKGKQYHFEVACYRNKVTDLRSGTELSIDEVLQSDRIFHSVSTGDAANSSDIKAVFGSLDRKEVCKKIVLDGQLQVSLEERDKILAAAKSRVEDYVSKHVMDKKTGSAVSVKQIKKALEDLGFDMHLDNHQISESDALDADHVKKISLQAMKLLEGKEELNIERSSMKLKLTFHGSSVTESSIEHSLAELASSQGLRYSKESSAPKDKDPSHGFEIVIVCHPSLVKCIFDKFNFPKDKSVLVESTVLDPTFRPTPQVSA